MKDFPIDQVRKQFPSLQLCNEHKQPAIFFDGPGGTQMTHLAIKGMFDYIKNGMANLHGTFYTSKNTDALLEEAKTAVGDFLNCKAGEVAFGQNMTSLAFQVSRNLQHFLKEGDEIVVTQQDHRANVDPWISVAKETGATIKFIPLDKESCTLDLSGLEKIITKKAKVVAVGLSSNVTGTITETNKILNRAKEVKALSIVDAVHAAPHFQVDFKKLDCEIMFCSAYKFFGPHIGIAVIKEAFFRRMPVHKVAPAPNEIPYKLETGTQNHEAIAGLCGAIAFIENLGNGKTRREKLISGMQGLKAYEENLMTVMQSFLEAIPEIILYRANKNIPKTPTFAFRIRNLDSRKAANFFAEKYNICLGDGHFYASTMAELFNVNSAGGWLRVGFAPYNTLQEIEIFKKALKECINHFSSH